MYVHRLCTYPRCLQYACSWLSYTVMCINIESVDRKHNPETLFTSMCLPEQSYRTYGIMSHVFKVPKQQVNVMNTFTLL